MIVNQDYDTANAIGSKSYNALTGELVSLDTENIGIQPKSNLEEDCVDFVAATTAALGVPSPSLSKTRSFDDSPHSVSDQLPRKGDIEEEAEFLRALKLSEVDCKASISDPVVGHVNGDGGAVSASMDEDMCNKQVKTVDSEDKLGKSAGAEDNSSHESEPSISDDCAASGKDCNEHASSASTLGETDNSSLKNDAISGFHQSAYMGLEESNGQNDSVEKKSIDALVQNESAAILSPEKASVSLFESCADVSGGGEKNHDQPSHTTTDHEVAVESQVFGATGISCFSPSCANTDSTGVEFHHKDASGELPSTIGESEPMYEGEECVLDTRTRNFEDREPVYEGEMVLAEQADKNTLAVPDLKAKDGLTPEQGQWCYLLNKCTDFKSEYNFPR